jgi:hypothetical protein
MSEQTYLRDPDEFGDRSWVAAWDDGNGIEIDAPGCGTAQLNNDEAMRLLAWLNKRYVLDELAKISDGG